jgi:uncharacterized membrane protein YqgA involved in biofilm formation
VTGTLLNALAILLAGSLAALPVPDVPARIQRRLQLALGALVLGLGFHIIWRACSGPGGEVLRLAGIGVVSLVLGKATGTALGIQRGLNRYGRFAGGVLNPPARPPAPPPWGEVFRAITVVFCVTPVAVVGAVQAGWGGDERLLFLKAAVDALATFSLTRSLGGTVVLGAVPVLALQGSLVLALTATRPFLAPTGADAAAYAASGFTSLPLALVMLQLARIPLADYLPTLLWAPLLGWLTR